MALFSTPTQIGVSIGTSSIKIAELKKQGKAGYSLVHFGIAQLPDEAITNREIANHMAVVDSIKGLVQQLKIKGRNCVTSLSGASVIVKKLLLEPVSTKELNDAILWEAEQYIPFDINDVAYDYQVINKNGPEGKMEIMLVACKRAIIEAYQAVLKDAGLNANIVDIDVFALQNTFETNYPPDACAALVDIGAASLKLSICAAGQPIFTRDSAIGGKALTAEIQKHLNVSYNEAELLKIDGNSQGQVPQEVSDLMHVMAENFAAEIKRSMDFYGASNAGTPLTTVLLAGGSCRLPNLSKMIEDAVGLPVQLLNPFNSVTYDDKVFTPDYINAVASMAAVPVGLALRGFPEMIRINLAKKQSKGGGFDLKSLNVAGLFAMLKTGGEDGAEKKFDINGPIPKTMVAFALCYFVNDYLEGVKIEELKKIDVEMAAVDKEKDSIIKKLAKIKGFEPLKKSLEEDEKALRLKLDVVQKLLEDRSGPAKMLMQITQSIPDEVWLTSLAVTEENVKLGGATPGYNQVSDFIKALNSTSQFSDITLSGIQEGAASGDVATAQKVQNFDLNAKRRHEK